MASCQDKQDLKLERLIKAYAAARAVWLHTADPNADLVSDGRHFDAFVTAGRAILDHPCVTLNAIMRKVSFVLEAPDLYTMVREDDGDSGDFLKIFLSSLISRISETAPRR